MKAKIKPSNNTIRNIFGRSEKNALAIHLANKTNTFIQTGKKNFNMSLKKMT